MLVHQRQSAPMQRPTPPSLTTQDPPRSSAISYLRVTTSPLSPIDRDSDDCSDSSPSAVLLLDRLASMRQYREWGFPARKSVDAAVAFRCLCCFRCVLLLLCLLHLVCSNWIPGVAANGILKFPPARNGVFPKSCAQCATGAGVCGNGPGSLWEQADSPGYLLGPYTTDMVKIKPGGRLKVAFYATADSLGGAVTLEICTPQGNMLTEECFQRIERVDQQDELAPLQYSPYNPDTNEIWYWPEAKCIYLHSANNPFYVTYRIPTNLQTGHAILRWFWQFNRDCPARPETSQRTEPPWIAGWTYEDQSLYGPSYSLNCGVGLSQQARTCGSDCPDQECVESWVKNCADVYVDPSMVDDDVEDDHYESVPAPTSCGNPDFGDAATCAGLKGKDPEDDLACFQECTSLALSNSTDPRRLWCDQSSFCSLTACVGQWTVESCQWESKVLSASAKSSSGSAWVAQNSIITHPSPPLHINPPVRAILGPAYAHPRAAQAAQAMLEPTSAQPSAAQAPQVAQVSLSSTEVGAFGVDDLIAIEDHNVTSNLNKASQVAAVARDSLVLSQSIPAPSGDLLIKALPFKDTQAVYRPKEKADAHPVSAHDALQMELLHEEHLRLSATSNNHSISLGRELVKGPLTTTNPILSIQDAMLGWQLQYKAKGIFGSPLTAIQHQRNDLTITTVSQQPLFLGHWATTKSTGKWKIVPQLAQSDALGRPSGTPVKQLRGRARQAISYLQVP